MNINSLELGDNHIQAEGAKYLAEMLRANFTITHLVCHTANLPLEGRRALQAAFVIQVASYYTTICFNFRIYPTTV